MKEQKHFFSPDKARKNPEKDDDLVVYAPFAKRLAEAIRKMAPPEGFVIALCGGWGTGKSTVIEFVQYYLKQKDNTEAPVVVIFNPWWFAGSEELTGLFFRELLIAVAPDQSRREEIWKRIGGFVGVISGAQIAGFQIGKGVADLFCSDKNLTELKNEMEEILEEGAKRILVIMDDIDRLSAKEIRELFRLIKAVGDFPNVTYLIAFDRKVVAEALSGSGVSGDDYLDKIVQLIRDIPKIDRVSLDKMFGTQLHEFLKDTEVPELDRDYWLDVYSTGIKSFLNTPRNVLRLVNALKLTHPAVAGEVNLADFVALEALGLFCPEVHRVIRMNPEMFAGGAPLESEVRGIREFHQDWVQRLGVDRDGAVQQLLGKIFPRFEVAFEGDIDDRPSEWRKALRACCPEKIDIYFRLNLHEGDLSRLELDQLLDSAEDPTRFQEALVRLSGQVRPDGLTRASQALEQLADFAPNDIEIERIPCIIEGLTQIGDKLLSHRDTAGLFGFVDNRDRIMRLMTILLGRLEQSERRRVAPNCVKTGAALATIVEFVSMLGVEHEKYSDQPLSATDTLVTTETLETMKQLAGDRIVEASQRGSLMDTPELDHVLYWWAEWRDRQEVEDWLIEDDRRLLALVRACIRDENITNAADHGSRRQLQSIVKAIQDVIDLKKFQDQIANLLRRDDLTENDKNRLKLLQEGTESNRA